MKTRLKKRKKQKRSLSYLNIIRRVVSRIYIMCEWFFKPDWITRIRIKRGKLKIPLEIAKMNRAMSWFYKRPVMKISEDFPDITYENTITEDEINISIMKYKCNPNSKKWVVGVHWFGGNKYWPLYNAIMFRKMGYNILSFDFRGHGKSQKDTTSMGSKEIYDLKAAIQHLHKTEDVESVALYGISMGAFCVSFIGVAFPDFCRQYKIKFGVCDSAYSSIMNLFMYTRDIYLKIIPKKRTKSAVTKFLVHHNKYENGRGFDWFETDIFKQIDNGNKPAFPILYLHSQNDKITNPIDSYKAFYKRSGLIEGDEVYSFRYGTHALMTSLHFKKVENLIGRFIAKNDNSLPLFEKVSEELKLDIVEKRDQKSEKLW